MGYGGLRGAVGFSLAVVLSQVDHHGLRGAQGSCRILTGCRPLSGSFLNTLKILIPAFWLKPALEENTGILKFPQ
jgi:hypothetical protein